MKLAEVGLARGVVSTVARVCKSDRAYVWQVAMGERPGTAAIRRQLLRRGWVDPRADQPAEPGYLPEPSGPTFVQGEDGVIREEL